MTVYRQCGMQTGRWERQLSRQSKTRTTTKVETLGTWLMANRRCTVACHLEEPTRPHRRMAIPRLHPSPSLRLPIHLLHRSKQQEEHHHGSVEDTEQHLQLTRLPRLNILLRLHSSHLLRRRSHLHRLTTRQLRQLMGVQQEEVQDIELHHTRRLRLHIVRRRLWVVSPRRDTLPLHRRLVQLVQRSLRLVQDIVPLLLRSRLLHRSTRKFNLSSCGSS